MSGRVGLVTGAARGMGLACATRIAPMVDVLLLADRDLDGATAAAAALTTATVRAEPLHVDVADRSSVQAMAAAAAAAGSLRAVAHAAGVSPTMAPARDVWQVDLVGSALVLDALGPLVGAGTAVVCFASMAAQIGTSAGDPAIDALLDDPLAPTFVDDVLRIAGMDDPANAYTWAKRGVQRLVRRTAVAWGPRGARVNSMSPGMIDTPMGRQEAAAQPMMQVLLDMTPLRREGTADELAAVVEFLLSDAAAFVTGTDLLVDGGVVAALGTPAR